MTCVVMTVVKRFIITNFYTVLNNFLGIIFIFVIYLKNPFKCPWEVKRQLEPPAPLTDRKYGVHKYLKANNTVLHYVESGDPSKPVMLFLHGFPELWYSWRHQLVNFNKNYRCIAVDMRGYGDSEKPDGVSSYKLELLVEDIRDLIRQLGLEKVILVGHDWGGVVAIRLRDTYPEVLNALVTLASASLEAFFEEIWNSASQRKKSMYVYTFRAPVIPEIMLQLNNLEVFEKFMLIEGKDGVKKEDIQCFNYWFGKQGAFTQPLNYYRANFKICWKNVYHEENVPFLAVLPDGDMFLGPGLLDVMKKSYTHIETTIVKDCGHFMQQEEPEKTNTLIRNFLNKHNL